MRVKSCAAVGATAIVLVAVAPRPVRAEAADDLFDPSQLHEIRLSINSRDLSELRARFEENAFYPADLVWRGIRVRNVAVRSRGFGSRNPVKLGLLIDMDRYTEGQQFLGLSSLVLDNFWQDPSMMREYLAMGFFRRLGQAAPRESFATLYINGVYQGVYAIVEDLDASFASRATGESGGTLFEYHWTFPFFGQFLGDDLEAYKPLFEPRTRELDPDSALWGPIRDLWQAVNDPDAPVWRDRVGRLIDLEQFVTQAAVENYLAENDGLLGYAGLNNFYLYRFAGSTRHRVFPWDKDTSFLQSDFALLQGIESNELMRRAFGYADLRALYFDVLARCVDVDRSEAWLAGRIEAVAALIAGAAHADPHKPTTNDQFDAAIDGLRAFAETRPAYVVEQLAALGAGASGEEPERRQQIEPGAPQHVFGDGRGRVGVAPAALGVDHLDVGGRARAEADVDDVHDLLRLVGGRARARQSALRARDGRPRRPHFRSGLRRGGRERGARHVQRRLTLRAQPRALAAVEERHRQLEQQARAVRGREELPRIDALPLQDALEIRVPVFAAVVDDAPGRLLLGCEQLEVGPLQHEARRRRRRVRAGGNGEVGLVGRVHRAVGQQQHAERFLRAVDRQLRRFDEHLVDGQLLLRAEQVQAAARAARLELARQIEVLAGRVARSDVAFRDAPHREDREVRVGCGERRLPPDVGCGQLGHVSRVLRLRAARPLHRRVQRQPEVDAAAQLAQRRHRRVVELHAAIERGGRDRRVHLEPRRGPRLHQERVGAHDAGGRDRAVRVALERARHRFAERHALHRLRRLRAGAARRRRGPEHDHEPDAGSPTAQQHRASSRSGA
jgi:hypothetical protein